MEKINVYHLNQNQKNLIVTGLKLLSVSDQSDLDGQITSNLINAIELSRDLALIITEGRVFTYLQKTISDQDSAA